MFNIKKKSTIFWSTEAKKSMSHPKKIKSLKKPNYFLKALKHSCKIKRKSLKALNK